MHQNIICGNYNCKSNLTADQTYKVFIISYKIIFDFPSLQISYPEIIPICFTKSIWLAIIIKMKINETFLVETTFYLCCVVRKSFSSSNNFYIFLNIYFKENWVRVNIQTQIRFSDQWRLLTLLQTLLGSLEPER